jgi:hypothetical protein
MKAPAPRDSLPGEDVEGDGGGEKMRTTAARRR